MKKRTAYILIVILVLVAGMVSAIVARMPRSSVTSDSSAACALASGCRYSNEAYSFTYPMGWSAAANAYAQSDALFGPDASGTQGEGGVEIETNQTSLKAYLNAQQANGTGMVSAQPVSTANGLAGDTGFVNAHGNGSDAYVADFYNKGTVYALYIHAESADDIARFDRLVSSFTVK